MIDLRQWNPPECSCSANSFVVSGKLKSYTFKECIINSVTNPTAFRNILDNILVHFSDFDVDIILGVIYRISRIYHQLMCLCRVNSYYMDRSNDPLTTVNVLQLARPFLKTPAFEKVSSVLDSNLIHFCVGAWAFPKIPDEYAKCLLSLGRNADIDCGRSIYFEGLPPFNAVDDLLYLIEEPKSVLRAVCRVILSCPRFVVGFRKKEIAQGCLTLLVAHSTPKAGIALSSSQTPVDSSNNALSGKSTKTFHPVAEPSSSSSALASSLFNRHVEKAIRKASEIGLSVGLDYGSNPIPRNDLESLVDAFVGAGADPFGSAVPLCVARESRSAQKLISYGIDVEKLFHDGRTAIQMAIDCNRRDTVRTLLYNGNANPNETYRSNDRRRTCMHELAERGDSALTSLILERGADPNAQDSEGLTPLMVGVINGHVPIVEILAACPLTDLSLVDNIGHTVKVHAMISSSIPIIRILNYHAFTRNQQKQMDILCNGHAVCELVENLKLKANPLPKVTPPPVQVSNKKLIVRPPIFYPTAKSLSPPMLIRGQPPKFLDPNCISSYLYTPETVHKLGSEKITFSSDLKHTHNAIHNSSQNAIPRFSPSPVFPIDAPSETLENLSLVPLCEGIVNTTSSFDPQNVKLPKKPSSATLKSVTPSSSMSRLAMNGGTVLQQNSAKTKFFASSNHLNPYADIILHGECESPTRMSTRYAASADMTPSLGGISSNSTAQRNIKNHLRDSNVGAMNTLGRGVSHGPYLCTPVTDNNDYSPTRDFPTSIKRPGYNNWNYESASNRPPPPPSLNSSPNSDIFLTGNGDIGNSSTNVVGSHPHELDKHGEYYELDDSIMSERSVIDVI